MSVHGSPALRRAIGRLGVCREELGRTEFMLVGGNALIEP